MLNAHLFPRDAQENPLSQFLVQGRQANYRKCSREELPEQHKIQRDDRHSGKTRMYIRNISISCAFDVAGLKPYCNILAIDAGKESGFDGLERDIKPDKSDGKPVKSILVNPETSKDSHTKQIISIRA